MGWRQGPHSGRFEYQEEEEVEPEEDFFNRKTEVVKNLGKALDMDNGVLQEILSNGIRT